jgi:Domain of unknown function (DUF4338)
MRYCGREFSPQDLSLIRQIIKERSDLNRTRLSKLVCEKLQWLKSNGGLKEMSCRVALIRMQEDGLVQLPPPTQRAPCSRIKINFTSRTDAGENLEAPVHGLGVIRLERVMGSSALSLWREYIERYHYLGYTQLAGAQIRYFVYVEDQRVALLSFSAAAWKTAPRDQFIGWNSEQRIKNLNYVVNNSRFLILPWIRSANLASKILSLTIQRLPRDWMELYAYQPVLLETFVESQRFVGGCYKAANWTYVGRTTGRGKLDRHHQTTLPEKSVWLYPLTKKFKKILCS